MLCATLAALLTAFASLLAAASAFAAGAVRACPTAAGAQPSMPNLGADEQATLCLVNRIRAAQHLHTLRANPQLSGVAASQVSSMVRRNWFSDIRPGGVTPMTLVGGTGYRAHAAVIAVGQNIAWGTGSFSTPAHIVAEWMASPPHRAIILSGEFRDAGVAIAPALPSVLGAGPAGATYAMEFAARHN
ncbi:MAG TPA: CAP domain-containing protein [Solirubrobacteraceae bacterium]